MKRYDSYLPLHGPRHLKRTIKSLCRLIQQKKIQFDAIAFRGYSGSLLAVPVALQMDKHLVIVRKPREMSHGDPVEGKVHRRYIIVDDHISSGNTVKSIVRTIDKWSKRYSKCVGIVLARQYSSICTADWNIPDRMKDIPIYSVYRRGTYLGW